MDADRTGVFEKRWIGMQSEHDEPGIGSDAADLLRRFNPIHHRHSEVKNYDVRSQFSYSLNRHLPILRLATKLPIRILFDQMTDCTADECVVIDDENFISHESGALNLGQGGPRQINLEGVSYAKGVLCLVQE